MSTEQRGVLISMSNSLQCSPGPGEATERLAVKASRPGMINYGIAQESSIIAYEGERSSIGGVFARRNVLHNQEDDARCDRGYV
jgi:hypothetical protein